MHSGNLEGVRTPRRLTPSLHAQLWAAAATTLAIALAWLTAPSVGDGAVLAFLPVAVAAAVWLAGVPAAVTAAVAGYLACDYLFIGTATGVGPYDAGGAVLAAIYIVCCTIIIALGESLWRARVREQRHRGLDARERRQAAEARAALTDIIETSHDAIVSKSLDGTILSWNPSAERLFGYSAEEAVGRSINLVIPPEQRDEERLILERLQSGDRVEHFETVRLTKSGRRINVSLSISPMRDEAGRIVGASKIARDVTEHKRAVAALQFSEERFRELANNIDQFAWTCDELAHANWYNKRWYDYTGATPDEMRGEGWLTRLDPAHLARVTAGIHAANARGDPWEDTFPLRGRDGNYRWFLSRAIPIRGGEGDVVRWFGTNTDVTERLKLEEELKAADARKDAFLATLAHELRNPLAPIRNALEILNLAGDDVTRATQAKDIMDRQITHLVRLVDDLLDVSRITRDRLDLRKVEVELNTIVEQTVGLHRHQADERGISLTVHLAPEPVHLAADPVRLAQILSNLLNNALRYTPTGGKVTVTVEGRGGEAMLSVQDTGLGIPPEQLDHIFEMFTQLAPTGETQGGLGIGLTLVKRLTELHGGSVESRSDGPGHGSTFLVRLPVIPAAGEGPSAGPSTSGTPAASRRVLVVEDNPDTAATLATLLAMSGHDARVANDGPEALELAESFRPEAVLLDLGLPGMNGLDVCRWIRQQPWGRSILVAALTGWGQESDRRRTEEAGFDEHLVKPVGPEAVLDLLAACRTARSTA